MHRGHDHPVHDAFATRHKYPVFDSQVFVAPGANVKLVVGTGERQQADKVLLTEDRPWEVRIDNGYPNVIHQQDSPRFRLWYDCFILCADPRRGCSPKPATVNGTHIPTSGTLYAESDNGIEWNKPNLSLVPFHDSVDNNIMIAGTHGLGITYERAPVNGRRYKAFGARTDQLVTGTMQSDDGLHWSDFEPSRPDFDNRFDTHHNHFYDSATQRHVLVTRGLLAPGRLVNRTIAFAESNSSTFGNFSRAEVRFATGDAHDQFYSMQVFPYFSAYLGIVMVYDSHYVGRHAADGVRCQLAYSNDLKRWQRLSEDIIPRPPGIMNCFAAKPVVADGRVHIFYMAGDGPHFGLRRTALQLSTFRIDGLLGARVANESLGHGTLSTRPLRVVGDNVAASFDGSIRVSVAHNGTVIYAAKDCILFTGPAIDARVQWRGSGNQPLAKLRGEEVVLTVDMYGADASLYTLSFV